MSLGCHADFSFYFLGFVVVVVFYTSVGSNVFSHFFPVFLSLFLACFIL